MENIKYTLCFIEKGNELLMLNRVKAPNMGLWNGVGGKLEKNEDKFCGIKREIKEETGLDISDIFYKGEVFWHINDIHEGMYVFTAKFPENTSFITPVEEIEGVLSFKSKEWIFNKENKGVISNISIFLEKMMLEVDKQFRFDFYYDKNEKIINYTFKKIEI